MEKSHASTRLGAGHQLFVAKAGARLSWKLALSLSCLAQLFLSPDGAFAQTAAHVQTTVSTSSDSQGKGAVQSHPSSAVPSVPARSAATQKSGQYVSGVLVGQNFVLGKAFYSYRTLYLRSTGAVAYDIHGQILLYPGIKIKFAGNQQLEGRTFKIVAGQECIDAGTSFLPKPQLVLEYMDQNALGLIESKSLYSMTLNFYKQQNGLQPGFIDLEILGGPPKTKIKGYFWAEPGIPLS